MLLPALENQDTAGSKHLTLEETLEVVRVPPPARFIGPRIEHIEVTADGRLSEAVASALALPPWFVLELIRFGAVHHSPVMPSPAAAARPHMSARHLQHVEEVRAAAIARYGRNPKLQHPKRVLTDVPVAPGGYIRVHVHPKRFPAAHEVDWPSRIIADSAEYVVVDKPTGVQVPPTVDNVLESVVSCTAAALGLPPDALLNTHRLDAGTSGVVVLAKSSAFAAWFSGLLRDKPDRLVKVYRCLTATPPPLGRLVHFAFVHSRGKGEPAHTRMRRTPLPASAAAAAGTNSSSSGEATAGDGEEGARCELVVEQVQQVSLTGSAAAEWGATAYESTLQLITGRTHQIRAQMAAEGCPLLGDTLYETLQQRWQQEEQGQQQLGQSSEQQQQQPGQSNEQQQQQIGQSSEQQQQQLGQSSERQQQQLGQSSEQQARHGGADWCRLYQLDPLKPIGLQAFKLKIRDEGGRLREQLKWWRQQQQQQEEQDDWVEFGTRDPWWRKVAPADSEEG